MCDNASVGYAWKIVIRLNLKTLNSFRHQLVNGNIGDLIYRTSMETTMISCTIYRHYVSRWSEDGNECNWLVRIKEERKALQELNK